VNPSGGCGKNLHSIRKREQSAKGGAARPGTLEGEATARPWTFPAEALRAQRVVQRRRDVPVAFFFELTAITRRRNGEFFDGITGSIGFFNDLGVPISTIFQPLADPPKAGQAIANYIRMNPWRCVMEFGNGLRGVILCANPRGCAEDRVTARF